MKQLNRIIIPLLVFFLLIGLIIGLRFYLLDYFIKPIALLAWGVWRIILSVDQQYYWLLLIIICGWLVFRLIPFWRRQKEKQVYRYAYRPPSQLEHWQTLIKDSSSMGNGRDQLRSSLKELVITLIAQDEKSDQSNAEIRITQEINMLPSLVRDYLFPPDQVNGIFTRNVQKRAWYRKISFIKQPDEYIFIDATLQWMETELEINHENQ